MTPAEQLATQKTRKRPPRNGVPDRHTTWASRIRAEREALNLSLRDVAQAVGISINALWHIEHGRDLMLTTAMKLAAFFGKPMTELWEKVEA